MHSSVTPSAFAVRVGRICTPTAAASESRSCPWLSSPALSCRTLYPIALSRVNCADRPSLTLLRRGATEPPKSHPSPKLPADAKGAQRAERPHPNHTVLPTTAQSGNSPLLPYQRRRSVPAAYAMHRTVAKCFICFTHIIPFRAALLPRSMETRLPAASLPSCDAHLRVARRSVAPRRTM